MCGDLTDIKSPQDDGTDEAVEENTSHERRTKIREGAHGDGLAGDQDEPRANAAAAAQHDKMSRYDRARHRSAAVHAPPPSPLTGHGCYFHVIPCTQNCHRAELDCHLCTPFIAQLRCTTASSSLATWTDDDRGGN